ACRLGCDGFDVLLPSSLSPSHPLFGPIIQVLDSKLALSLDYCYFGFGSCHSHRCIRFSSAFPSHVYWLKEQSDLIPHSIEEFSHGFGDSSTPLNEGNSPICRSRGFLSRCRFVI